MDDDDEDMSFFENQGYVQITEFVEIDFPDLAKDAIVNNQIVVLDKEINRVMAETEVKVNKLKARKQELLAISHDV